MQPNKATKTKVSLDRTRSEKTRGIRTFGHSSESQDTTLSLHPLGREELLLEVREEDLEQLSLEDYAHHVESSRRALPEVPFRGESILVVVVLVVVIV